MLWLLTSCLLFVYRCRIGEEIENLLHEVCPIACIFDCLEREADYGRTVIAVVEYGACYEVVFAVSHEGCAFLCVDGIEGVGRFYGIAFRAEFGDEVIAAFCKIFITGLHLISFAFDCRLTTRQL